MADTLSPFYVVDDLLRGTLNIAHFRRLSDAIAAYKALPAASSSQSPEAASRGPLKALGVQYEGQAVDLVRCLPLLPNDSGGEDVAVAEFLEHPLWKSRPGIVPAAQELAARLHIRYCLFRGCLLPAPDKDKLPRALRNTFLWPDVPGDFYTAAQWIYVAGAGRLSPAEFKRRYGDDNADVYPLVTHISAFGVDKRGNYHSLQVTPWEFHLLVRRSRERLDQNKN